MKKRIVFKWALFGAALLTVFLVIKWYDDSQPLKILITPEGDKLEYIDYYYGYHADLRERTGPWWKFWEEPKYLMPGPHVHTENIPQDRLPPPGDLLLWFSHKSIGRVMQSNTELVPILVEVSDDQGARVFTPVARVSLLSEGARYLEAFRHSSFPRRGRTLTARYFSRSFKEPIGVVRFENPERRTFPEWKTRPLPLTQTDADLTLTLTQCKLSKTTYFFRPNYQADRSMGDTENASIRESIACLATEFHAQEKGRNADGGFQILSAVISDATGNRHEEFFNSFWVKERRFDAPYYDVVEGNGSETLKRNFKYGFSSGEKAVRLEVQTIRSSNASLQLADQERIFSIAPPLENNSVSFQKIYVDGLPVQLALSRAGKNLILDELNTIETNSPCVILKVPPVSPHLYSSLLSVTDSHGNALSNGYVLKDLQFKSKKMVDYSLVFERSQDRANWALSSFSKAAFNPNMGRNGDGSFDVCLFYPFRSAPKNERLTISIAPNPARSFEFIAPVATH